MMNLIGRGLVGGGFIRTGLTVAAVAAGVVAARRVSSRLTRSGGGHWPTGRPGRQTPQRWHSVTVNRPLDQVAPDGRLPEPLARLGEMAEIRIRPAPADRGTELAARPYDRRPFAMIAAVRRFRGRDPLYPVRSALRETKLLVETGEVLNPDHPPTTKPVPRNRPLQMVTRRAREEGRL